MILTLCCHRLVVVNLVRKLMELGKLREVIMGDMGKFHHAEKERTMCYIFQLCRIRNNAFTWNFHQSVQTKHMHHADKSAGGEQNIFDVKRNGHTATVS